MRRSARPCNNAGRLGEAIEALSADEALGDHIFERYVDAKTQEDEYRISVSQWMDRYLSI